MGFVVDKVTLGQVSPAKTVHSINFSTIMTITRGS
jgi:hypothetical protein